MSQREAARVFNVSRDTVRKMMAFSVPPGYRRRAEVRRPKLDPFIPIIEGWLEADRTMPRKQRHTAKRVFDRLCEECGFTGGYTIIKDYIRERERRGQEVFVPLSHPPGHAQADFGEALVRIGGVEQKAHFFVLDLPHSDGCYVRAYPAAVAEAWVDGHIHAFAFFGAVPQSVLYDNDRCLVAKILPDGTRKRASLFSGFLSHYLIRDRYGRPGKGNNKGNVEGLVGYSRRNFMVPMPEFATLAPPEAEDLATMRIATEPLLDLQCEAVHPAAHVRHTARDPDLHPGRKRDHCGSNTVRSAANCEGSSEAGIVMQRPFVNVTSIRASLA
ncbi:MAG TPA: IS21 family transposase, partial [Paenirhodobacter sp.]